MKTHWLLGIKEDNAAACYADASKHLPVGTVVAKLSRNSSPVCALASQKLLSPGIDELSGQDRFDMVSSPSNFVTQSAYMEMEQYIIDNDIALFSDECSTPTPDGRTGLSDNHTNSLQSSVTQSSLLSSNSVKKPNCGESSLNSEDSPGTSPQVDDRTPSSTIVNNAMQTSNLTEQKEGDEKEPPRNTKCSVL